MKALIHQVAVVFRRDLLIERRAGEVIGVIGPLSAVAVFIVPLAIDRLSVDPSDVGPPVFWLVSYLFGMQVALRHAASETVTQRRHLALAGIDPLARLIGRAGSAAVLLAGTIVVTWPLTLLFYDLELPKWWRMVMPLALFAVGLAIVATLAGEITSGLSGRTVLAPLLVAPLAVPLLVGGSTAWESVVQETSTLTGVLILAISVLAGIATMALTARALEDATT